MTPERYTAVRAAHRARVQPWIEAHRLRGARGQKHPVHDFLFTYYSFRPAHLGRYSPGHDRPCPLPASESDWPSEFVPHDGGCILPGCRFPAHRHSYLAWAIDYQRAIAGREAQHACFGLHEWAMVYRTQEIRHAAVPLRVRPETVAALVESQGLRCSHYDAYRFFTPAARPLNRVALTRADTPQHDQPGCIHANMDLYKFAYAIAPYSSSDLIADCFELAAAARAIDMRASPYDLRDQGYEPIAIETKAGREAYVHEQRTLAKYAEPLRQRVITAYETLHAVTTA
jgi:hypothetical protein